MPPPPSTTAPAIAGHETAGSGGGADNHVRVVCRIRPLAEYEKEKGCQEVIKSLPPLVEGGVQQLHVTEPESKWFELDAVLGQQCSQEDVYVRSGAREAVCDDLFRGFNCTILAYGQTGAGKTFTMGTAPLEGSEISEYCGIIPRACSDLFEQIQEKCDGNAKVALQYLEVYNEDIRDLLAETAQPLRIRESLDGEVYVRGLQSRDVKSPADIGACMKEASGRRVVASTKMNAASSRSHAIAVLRITGMLEDATKFTAKLTLVDLAGSERIKKTGAEGNRAQEGISINKGLFVLGQVVSALAEQRPKMKRKPPYRDSKLTRLLQDSLGGNSRTIMVACVSPADFNVEESVNTLRYATSARNIKNIATRNVVQTMSVEEAAKIRRENELLVQQVKDLESIIAKLTQDVRDLEEAVEEAKQLDENEFITELAPRADDIEASEHKDDLISRESITLGGRDSISLAGRESITLDSFLANGGAKKTYEELEKENKALRNALQRGQSDMRSIAAESAIELPAMKKKVKMLEHELHESMMLGEEAEQLRRELEETKAEATAARHAADQLSHFMEEQLSQSQRLTCFTDEELDEKRTEYQSLVMNEEWVNLVAGVLRGFQEQLRQLGDFFALVVRIVDSPDIISTLVPPKPKTRRLSVWGNSVEAEKEQLDRKKK